MYVRATCLLLFSFRRTFSFNASSENSWKLLQTFPGWEMDVLFIHRTGLVALNWSANSNVQAVPGHSIFTFQDNFWWLQSVFLENGQDGKDKGVDIPIHCRLDQELQNSVHILHSHLMAAASSYSTEQSWKKAASLETNSFLLPTHWVFQSKTK